MDCALTSVWIRVTAIPRNTRARTRKQGGERVHSSRHRGVASVPRTKTLGSHTAIPLAQHVRVDWGVCVVTVRWQQTTRGVQGCMCTPCIHDPVPHTTPPSLPPSLTTDTAGASTAISTSRVDTATSQEYVQHTQPTIHQQAHVWAQYKRTRIHAFARKLHDSTNAHTHKHKHCNEHTYGTPSRSQCMDACIPSTKPQTQTYERDIRQALQATALHSTTSLVIHYTHTQAK